MSQQNPAEGIDQPGRPQVGGEDEIKIYDVTDTTSGDSKTQESFNNILPILSRRLATSANQNSSVVNQSLGDLFEQWMTMNTPLLSSILEHNSEDFYTIYHLFKAVKTVVNSHII